MVLLVLGFLFLGRGFAFKTVYVSLLSSIGLSVMEKIWPLSGPVTDQPVLELIFAIFLPGAASAVLFNMGASSGGTDIVAMIIKKYRSLEIGTSLFVVDCLIAVSAFFVFDAQTGLFSLCGLLAKSLEMCIRDSYTPSCMFCGGIQNIKQFGERFICLSCANKIKDGFE